MVQESFIQRKAKMLQILNETWTKLVSLAPMSGSHRASETESS